MSGMNPGLKRKLRGNLHLVLSSVGHLLKSSEDSLLCIMCLRCIRLDYTPEDYGLLQNGSILQGLRCVMNASETSSTPAPSTTRAINGNPNEADFDASMAIGGDSAGAMVVKAHCTRNITALYELGANAAGEMVGSLTDGNTETFWQTGRNLNNTFISIKKKDEAIESIINEVSIHVDHTRLKDHNINPNPKFPIKNPKPSPQSLILKP